MGLPALLGLLAAAALAGERAGGHAPPPPPRGRGEGKAPPGAGWLEGVLPLKRGDAMGGCMTSCPARPASPRIAPPAAAVRGWERGGGLPGAAPRLLPGEGPSAGSPSLCGGWSAALQLLFINCSSVITLPSAVSFHKGFSV